MHSSRILRSAVLGSLCSAHRAPSLGDLGPVGRCADRPTLVICICDDSGSVTAPGGTDPISNRYRELEGALRHFARSCRCGHELAAVLHFDSPHGDVGPVPMNRRGMTQLLPTLRVPPGGMGTSDLLPSLRRAVDLADDRPEHDVVLVIFSDFYLTDHDPNAVADEVGTFPGPIYACTLGGSQQLPYADHQIAIDDRSPPGTVARALLGGLTHYRTVRRPESPDTVHPPSD